MYTKEFADATIQDGEVTAVIAHLNVVDRDEDYTLPGAFGEQDVAISA